MNDTIDAGAENQVARYATAVRAAFADLPGPDRELLLEDLEDHLQEVAAEAGGPLSERLGRPEAYAAELRASAGLPAPDPGAHREGGSWLRRTWGAQQLGRLWAAVSTHPAARATLDFLPELRPAWWVLRGYLAVQAVGRGHLLAVPGRRPQLPGAGPVRQPGPRPARHRGRGGGLGHPGPAPGGGQPADPGPDPGRERRPGPVRRAMVLRARGEPTRPTTTSTRPSTSSSSTPATASGLRADGREISNIFPFDADGKPLQDVYLIDQDGAPLIATSRGHPSLEPPQVWDRDGNDVANRYPQVQHHVDPAPGSGPRPRPRSSSRRRARCARPDRLPAAPGPG